MTPTSSTFDVVIPAFNAGSTIVEQLDAVRTNDSVDLLEVLVVDSCSTDTTVKVVAEYSQTWPKVRITSTSRPGANVARNAGIAEGSGEFVLLCDADDVVGKGWAEALVTALVDHDVVRGRYEVNLLNDASTIIARGSIGSTAPPPSGSPIDGLGGNCGFRRTAWDQLGGLSETHTGSDDVEFFWRAALAGLAVGYVDSAVVHYRLRPSYRDLYRQQRSWVANRALLYREFGNAGLIERRTLTAGLKNWGWLLLHLPASRSNDPERRGMWTRSAASAVGHVRGSFRHRVWYP